MTDNVVELRPGQDMTDDQRILQTAPKRASVCAHKARFRLDSEAQRAYCVGCESEVPLFQVLKTLASHVERYVEQRNEAKRRAEVARGDLVEILRLERNAKARMRKAVAKAPACSCSEAQQRRRARWPGFAEPWCPKCGGRR